MFLYFVMILKKDSETEILDVGVTIPFLMGSVLF